jgi:hypothetical protein
VVITNAYGSVTSVEPRIPEWSRTSDGHGENGTASGRRWFGTIRVFVVLCEYQFGPERH